MAAFALTAAGTLWDDNDISCFVDTLTLDGTAVMLPTTTMCAGGFEQFTPGVASFTSAFEGPVDYASGAIGQYVTPVDIGRLTPISTFPLALPANLTVTFAGPKRGHFMFPGAAACGELVVAAACRGQTAGL